MRDLVADTDALSSALADSHEGPVYFFYLLRSEAEDPAADLARALAGLDAELVWSARADMLFIGEGQLHWTHAAIVRLLSRRALLGLSEPPRLALDDLQVSLFRPQQIPLVARALFRMLRPLGWFLEPSDHLASEFLDQPSIFDDRSIHPSLDRLRFLAADTRDVPAFMINLLRFRERADYEDGRTSSDVSGYRAYQTYGAVAFRSVMMLGGSILHLGRLGPCLIAAEVPATGGDWHELAIVRYPTPRQLLKLSAMPGYPAALAHRTAGLERTALVIATPNGSQLPP